MQATAARAINGTPADQGNKQDHKSLGCWAADDGAAREVHTTNQILAGEEIRQEDLHALRAGLGDNELVDTKLLGSLEEFTTTFSTIKSLSERAESSRREHPLGSGRFPTFYTCPNFERCKIETSGGIQHLKLHIDSCQTQNNT